MTKRTVFATAAAVFAVGAFTPAAFAQVACAGANACKGQSACKSAKSSCKGQNGGGGSQHKLPCTSACPAGALRHSW